MADEEITVQTIWMLQQSPAHFAKPLRQRHDVLLVHRVDAWAIGRVRGLKIVASIIRWPDVPMLESISHLGVS